MSYLIVFTFCFFSDEVSKLLIPEMNLARLLFFSGQITKDVEVEGVLIKSIIESFLSKILLRAKATSPVYSQISVKAGISSAALTIKP